MSGSKVYIKKPVRRYERAFESEQAAPENGMQSAEDAVVYTDITSTQPPPDSQIGVKASAVRRSRVRTGSGDQTQPPGETHS